MKTLAPLYLIVACWLCGCASAPVAEDIVQKLGSGLQLRFVRNKTVSDGLLYKACAFTVKDMEDKGITPALLDDVRYTVEQVYQEYGFGEARVQVRVSEKDAKRVVVDVHEGVRTVISGIRFEGNLRFSDDELALLLKSPHSGLLALGLPCFSEAAASDLRSAVRNLYLEASHLGVSLADPTIEFNADRTEVDVSYTLSEGPQYILTQITLDPRVAPEHAVLSLLTEPYLNQPYLPRIAFKVRAAVTEYYANRGYADVRVTNSIRLDPSSGQVALALQIEPGTLVTITDVGVSGAKLTKPDFIRSRLLLQPGDRYSAELRRRSFRRLVGTGLFSRARLELEESEDSGRALELEVEESSPIELWAEPGFGAYELARIRFGVSHNNVMGTGRRLHGEGGLAVRSQHGKLGIADPWLWGSEVSLDATTFITRREEPSYTEHELGGALSLSRSWKGGYHVGWSYRMSRSRATSVETVEDDIDTDVQLATMGLAASLDTRDNPFMPHSGWVVRAETEWSSSVLGSELDALRIRPQVTGYLSLTDRTVLAAHGSAEVAIPLGATDELPLQERVFSGGENTVRSFREDDLGPKDTYGKPVGGESRTLVSAELRQRLCGNIYAALFYDAGNVAQRYTDALRFEGFRHGVGAGIRYALPIGPIRLDVGVNPSRHHDEDSYVVQFSVGLGY